MEAKKASPIELSITNFSACCRICLSSSENDYCFHITDNCFTSHTDVTVIEALKKVLNVEIQINEKLPSKVCESCVLRLADALSFIWEASRNNDLLQKYIDNGYSDEWEPLPDNYEEASAMSVESEDEPAAVTAVDIIEKYTQPSLTNKPPLEHQKNENSTTINLDSSDESAKEKSKNSLNAVELILQQMRKTVSDETEPRKPTVRQRNRRDVKPLEHPCDLCPKTFRRKSNLNDHLRLHAQLKMYECEYCDKRFVQSGNLRTHLRTHTSERPFTCHICQKGFNQSSALKTHTLLHTKERPWTCEICDKSFMSTSDLSKHKLTHLNEKPFRCVICPDKPFTQKVHLRNHLTRIHPTSNIQLLLEQGVVLRSNRNIKN